MSTDPIRVERRCGQRFQLNLPLTIHVGEKTVPGFTQDVSSRGVFLYTEANLAEGAVVELTFTMPSEITLGENMRVRGRGRVLRADSSQAVPRNGIAVQLDSYQYLASLESGSTPELTRVSASDPNLVRPATIPR